MKSSLLRFVAVLFAFGLVAAACGGDDDVDADTAALITAVQGEMEVDDLPDGFSQSDVDCVAEAMVKGMGGASGAEEKYGITVDNIDAFDDWEPNADDAEKAVDGMADCVNLKELFVAEMEGFGLPDDTLSCITDKLTNDMLKTAMLNDLTGSDDDAFDDQMEAVFGECQLG